MIYNNSWRWGPAINWWHGWICDEPHLGGSRAYPDSRLTISSKETIPTKKGVSSSNGYKTENHWDTSGKCIITNYFIALTRSRKQSFVFAKVGKKRVQFAFVTVHGAISVLWSSKSLSQEIPHFVWNLQGLFHCSQLPIWWIHIMLSWEFFNPFPDCPKVSWSRDFCKKYITSS